MKSLACSGRRAVYLMTVLTLGSTAWANHLVVGTNECATPDLLPMVRAVRQATAAQKVPVLSEEEVRKALGAAPGGSAAEAERLIASAKADYFDASTLDRAERSLETALTLLHALPGNEARWTELRDVHIMLGQLASRRGQQDRARERLWKLFRVEPDAPLDPDRYSPALRKFAEGVRDEVKRQKVQTLTVTSAGEPMELFVDGRPVGRTPATLKLVPGDYAVQARVDDRRAATRRVKLSTTQQVEFDPTYERAIRVDAGPCLQTGPERERRLRMAGRLGAQLGASRVITLRFEEPNPGERYLVGAALEVPSGTELREGRIKVRDSNGEVEGSTEALERLAAFITTGHAVLPVEPLRPRVAVHSPLDVPSAEANVELTDSAPPRPPGQLQRWSAYAAGGVGVAALTGASVFLVRALNTQSDRDAVCSPQGDAAACSDPALAAGYKKLDAEYETDRKRATILGVGALVALGAGAVLYATAAKPRSDVAPASAQTPVRVSVGVAPTNGAGAALSLSGSWW